MVIQKYPWLKTNGQERKTCQTKILEDVWALRRQRSAQALQSTFADRSIHAILLLQPHECWHCRCAPPCPLTHLAFILFLMSDYFFTPNGGMGHSLHMCGAQEFFSPSSMWVLKDPNQVVRLPSDHLYPPTLPAASGSTLCLSLLFALRHWPSS